MKIVIDIPDNEVPKRREIVEIGLQFMDGEVCECTYPFQVLPKGHGRLIDADYLKDVILLHNFHGNNKNIVPYSDRRGYRLRQREVDEGIINAPTIIEADKETENE